MREILKNKKILLIVCSIILIIAIAAVSIFFILNDGNGKSSETDGEGNASSSEASGSDNSASGSSSGSETSSDVIYITNCDTETVLEEKQNLLLVEEDGYFVEGTGAFMNNSTSVLFFSGKLKKAVDISKLRAGYLHFAMYFSSTDSFVKELYFEISSSGTCDSRELCWKIPPEQLKKGWNEFNLPITSGVKTGKIDLEQVNYFRAYSPEFKVSNGSVDIIMDDFFASKSPVYKFGGNNNADNSTPAEAKPEENKTETDRYSETTAKAGKMIASFNTKNIFESSENLTVTTENGQYVEGSGAMKVTGAASAAFELKEAINIKDYFAETGAMHISIYVDNAEKINGTTEISFSDADDIETQRYYLRIQPYEFKSGWNDFELPIYACGKNIPPNPENIKYFKITIGSPAAGTVIILDNFYITK